MLYRVVLPDMFMPNVSLLIILITVPDIVKKVYKIGIFK